MPTTMAVLVKLILKLPLDTVARARHKMAKNTRSYAFRSVDVDLYNEDAYKEEEEAEKKKSSSVFPSSLNVMSGSP